MKGSPLNAVGDKTTKPEKEGNSWITTTSDMQDFIKNNLDSTKPTKTGGSSRGGGSNTSSSGTGRGSASGGFTPKSTPSKTPAPSKTPEATSGNKKDYFASTAKALTAYSLKSDNNKGAKGAAVKEFAGTAEFLNAGKDVSFTPGYKPSSKPSKEKAKSTKSTEVSKSRKKMKADKMANKVSDAPKSRKEMRMAKAKNKALKAKETAASSTKMESRMAAGAKAKRLEKRAERIENRIAKKNKK